MKVNEKLSISEKLDRLSRKIDHVPDGTSVRHHHHFDLRSKGFITSATVLLLVTAISVGFLTGILSENSRMRENDLKYRMIRQAAPAIAQWADSTYHRNPELAEEQTRMLEARQEAQKRETEMKTEKDTTEQSQYTTKKNRKKK